MRIVLASESPRRKLLMKQVCDDYEIVTADIDEYAIEKNIMKNYFGSNMQEAAKELCMVLAHAKAIAVFNKLGRPADTIVLGADTVVALPDEILGKPLNKADAIRMLRKESLTPQHVITGVSFIKQGSEKRFCVESKVVFKVLDAEQERRIQLYCDSDEPYDKAGAYGLQDNAASLVDYYEGDFTNIVGFPVDRVKEELEKFYEQ